MTKSLITSVVALTLGSINVGVGIILMALLVRNGVVFILIGTALITFALLLYIIRAAISYLKGSNQPE